LNQSTGIARVDLSDWSSTQVVLSELGSSRSWDVIEISPGVVLVSANPGNGGLAWIVRYNFDTATEERVASERIIRAGPRFAMDGGDHVYIGEGFSPNSLYQLDLASPLLDIVAEDDHGSVGGTQSLAVSADGSFVVVGSGQKLDATTLVPIGSFEAGVPLFSDDGSVLYTLHDPMDGPTLVQVSDATTTQLIEEWEPDCGSVGSGPVNAAFVKGVGSSALLATTKDSLCIIHSDTVRPPPEPPEPPPASLPDGGRFFDDDGNIHEVAIEAIAAAGITRGCNPPYQTGYCPDSVVTRGQMAAFLVRALGLTDAGGGNSFADDDESIFENDIAKLAAAGITRGCNPPANTMFCPTSKVTRGQMAAFLTRALGLTDRLVNAFGDDDGSVFEGDIERLAAAGITRGCNPPSNTKFCPNSPVTRAQMATFLTRALDLTVRNVPPRLETTNGADLDVISAAEMRGCTGRDGEVCTISNNLNGQFYLETGWFTEDWSAETAAQKAAFRSNRVRVEAAFDGVPIELVEWPFEVVDNVAFKTYSFQFPAWLQGSHVLEIDYIDDTDGYRWTLRDNLSTHGSGYGLTIEPPTASAGTSGTAHDNSTHLSRSP
jgi:hypothetical protein